MMKVTQAGDFMSFVSVKDVYTHIMIRIMRFKKDKYDDDDPNSNRNNNNNNNTSGSSSSSKLYVSHILVTADGVLLFSYCQTMSGHLSILDHFGVLFVKNKWFCFLFPRAPNTF